MFFFSSRGSVGRPVTHRRGRGWRGGFLGSATEQFIKLDLNKWLKVLRHLELLPRPLGQDWSEVWLQRFGGTVTIWPKTVLSDLYFILSDPTPPRLARMLHGGQQSAFPKIKFISNRMKLENAIAEGVKKYASPATHAESRVDVAAEDAQGPRYERVDLLADDPARSSDGVTEAEPQSTRNDRARPFYRRSSSMLQEFRRQSAVFFDDDLYDTGPSDEDRSYRINRAPRSVNESDI